MLELQTFGGLALRTGAGETVEALETRTKCLALLAYLAAEAPDGRVPREEVAGLLWSGRPDDRARNSLRVTLSRIRQATDVVLVEGEGEAQIGLARDRLRADVSDFREAIEAGDKARALELYRGDFLAGVRVPNARGFQRWADERRGRLRREAYEAALALGDRSREEGELEAAEDRFRTALDLAPLREEAAERLIRTLAERGRASDAVQLFEAFRDRRREELEMEPSDELVSLVEELRRAPPTTSGPDAGRGGGEEADAPTPGSASETRGEPDEASGERERRRRGIRRHLPRFLIAAGLATAALIGVWQFWGSGGTTSAETSERPAVAVLPFGVIGDEESELLAEGLHSDLLTRLSHVAGLQVLSGTSMRRFRGSSLSLPAIADSVGADWVLEGDVQRVGDQVGINVQLIDPATDGHVWAETYRRERTAEGIIRLQGDIARRVADVLETRLGSGEEGRLYRQETEDLDAYRFYVRGRSLLEERSIPSMRRGLEYFERALADDSAYALAWAGVADGLSLLAHHGAVPPDSALPPAGEAARRALEVDPDLAEAHVALGRLHLFRHDGPAALQALERAVELRPGYAAAHAWLSKIQLTLGQPREGLEHVEKAVELDPLSPENQATLSWAAMALGRYDVALRAGRRVSEMKEQVEEEFQPPSQYEVLALSHLGKAAELEAVARERSDLLIFRLLAAAAAVEAGAPDSARRLLEGVELTGEEFPLTRVLYHAVLGQRDSAFEEMRAGFPREEGLWEVGGPIFLRYYWPKTLESVRADPRYDEIMADIDRFWGLNPDGSLPAEPAGPS